MKRFIRLTCFTGFLLSTIIAVHGQTRQVKFGDNLGAHMASKDLDMNIKQILNADGIAIGSATITNQNVALQIDGTNKAILMPRINALVAITSPVNGMLVYNSADNKFYVRENGQWQAFATVTDLNSKASNITVDNISIIKDNTGALAANMNSAIWNANRLQGNAVSATAPQLGQVLSWDGSSWVPSTATAATAGTVTSAAQPAITSVGTLTGLTVTAPIVGSIAGNAATVTTNANLTGVVTSTGNTTAIANGTITNAMLANTAIANLSGTNTGDQDLTGLAPLASPDLTGNPTAPNQTAGDNSTKIANTAYVDAAAAAGIIDASTVAKGKIQLAGDLAGTAALPVIAANAVTTAKIADANITADKIAANAVGTTAIIDANVTTAKIAADAVTTAKILNANVTTTKIAPGGNNQLLSTDGAGVVTWVNKSSFASNTLANGSVLIGDGTNTAAAQTISGDITLTNAGVSSIGASKVVTGMIADGTIATADLANDAVTTTKIANNNVTYGKMQAVTANRLLGSGLAGTAVSEVTLGTGLTYTGSTLNVSGFQSNTLTDGSVLIGNGSNVATAVALTGDITLTNAGVSSIGASKVVTGMILDGTVATADLADASVTLAKQADIATASLLGRITAGPGAPEVLNAAAVKTLLALGNVSNTSDANKPVSTAGQTALDLKANLESPAFTGTPTAETQAFGDNSSALATTSFVQTANPVRVVALKDDGRPETALAELREMSIEVDKGTYTFQYFVIYLSEAVKADLLFSLDFTGVSSALVSNLHYRDPAFPVDSRDPQLVSLEGVILVTKPGTLRFSYGSNREESTILAGTSLVLTRTSVPE